MYFLPSRPAWHTILWPLLYIASSALMGIFLMYLWTLVTHEDESLVHNINRWAVIALVVDVALIVAYLIFLALTPFPHVTRSPMRLLGGDLALVFWIGLVLVGIVVPFILTGRALLSKRPVYPSALLVALAFLCVVAGGLAMRSIMYAVGTSIEQWL